MLQRPFPRVALACFLSWVFLTAIFAVLLIQFRRELRSEIQQKIIERDAATLYPMALLQMADAAAGLLDSGGIEELLSPVLRSAQQSGMLAVAIFDADGNPLRAVPNNLFFVELPVDDYLALTQLKPISRYHPAFRLDRTFAGISPEQSEAPVLEVLIPLHYRGATRLEGVARYYIDARGLANELAAIDQQVNQQTAVTVAIAGLLIAMVLGATYVGLHRAQRVIAERNERLTRTNLELTLAVKTSALGQITSHLIHGLQGSVAGLRALVGNGHEARTSPADWESAIGYTERMQALIHETVSLLSDTAAHANYQLTVRELADTIARQNESVAKENSVILEVRGDFAAALDSHRGSLLCLIISNLVQNAIAASDRGRRVLVSFHSDDAELRIRIADEGHGIPAEILSHLFEPGRTTRAGGTGLGLAISQLLAKQIGADLSLESTGPEGTAFQIRLSLEWSGADVGRVTAPRENAPNAE